MRELYGICPNTLSNWIGKGLRPSDRKTPYVFQGAELKRFHRACTKPRYHVNRGETLCLGCRSGVTPEFPSFDGTPSVEVGGAQIGHCPNCGARVSKFRTATVCDKAKSQTDPNISPDRTDERVGLAQACVGTDAADSEPVLHFANDRILLAWQVYAGRYAEATIEAHLTAIREFEHFVEGKPFDRVTPEDADLYRSDLIRRSKLSRGDGGLRRSTLRHRASHLGVFFAWLCNEDDYSRLNRSLPKYFDLPRGSVTTDLELPARPFPTIEEAIAMVTGMPAGSVLERRACAIVATAFVFGLRASALISLRRKHLDVERMVVDHDGRAIRAKNGKSFRIFAFPRTDSLHSLLQSWYVEHNELGFGAEDALFPSDRDLRSAESGIREPGKVADPMKASGAVTAAFQVASVVMGQFFNPHSARHCLADLGRRICRPPFETSAWSANLGHESDRITDRHYGKVTEAERGRVMQDLAAPTHFTEREKNLMLDYHQHRLIPGSPEFDQARGLVRQRENTTVEEVVGR